MTIALVVDLDDRGIPVTRTCQVPRFPRQAINAGRADLISEGDWDSSRLASAAIDIHADYASFGYHPPSTTMSTLPQGFFVGRARSCCWAGRTSSSA